MLILIYGCVAAAAVAAVTTAVITIAIAKDERRQNVSLYLNFSLIR